MGKKTYTYYAPGATPASVNQTAHLTLVESMGENLFSIRIGPRKLEYPISVPDSLAGGQLSRKSVINQLLTLMTNLNMRLESSFEIERLTQPVAVAAS